MIRPHGEMWNERNRPTVCRTTAATSSRPGADVGTGLPAWWIAGVALLVALLAAGDVAAQEARRMTMSPADRDAMRVLDRAMELLETDERARGRQMMSTLIDQFPDSRVRFMAMLELGRNLMSTDEQLEAVARLRGVRKLAEEFEKSGEEMGQPWLDVYLESLYLTGVAYFEAQQFASVFPVLRKITQEYPNTIWSNQAYYYIGMCHFAQGNWPKAIRALTLVGTFVDIAGGEIEYVEAGRRFYTKVADDDLPIMVRLGEEVRVRLKTASGDEATITLVPLAGDEAVYIGSIATELAKPKPGDEALQVVGGDVITATYVDTKDASGESGQERLAEVRVVSTAGLRWTLGDFDTPAGLGFLNHPLYLVLQDSDLDQSDAAETASVRITVRYRAEDAVDEEETVADVEAMLEAGGEIGQEEEPYEIRDEMTVTLEELGEGGAIRSGRFGGMIRVQPSREGETVDKADDVLVCAVGDEVVAEYVDERHIDGETPREVEAMVTMAPSIPSEPRADVFVIEDPVVLARANLIEAEANLRLTQVYRSLGLKKRAASKAGEGLAQVDEIIDLGTRISSEYLQQAFQLRWNLLIATERFGEAIATCNLYVEMYPDSPFVDQALSGIAETRMEREEYDAARTIYEQILRLPTSQIKDRAVYQLGVLDQIRARQRAIEQDEDPDPGAGFEQFKRVYEQFPDSELAGDAIKKVIEYHMAVREYAQADDLLEQVFQDYPDETFLDALLLEWTKVAFRMGDLQKAHEKCQRLVFEYPNSPWAKEAQPVLAAIEQRLARQSGG